MCGTTASAALTAGYSPKRPERSLAPIGAQLPAPRDGFRPRPHRLVHVHLTVGTCLLRAADPLHSQLSTRRPPTARPLRSLLARGWVAKLPDRGGIRTPCRRAHQQVHPLLGAEDISAAGRDGSRRRTAFGSIEPIGGNLRACRGLRQQSPSRASRLLGARPVLPQAGDTADCKILILTPILACPAFRCYFF